nr:hypothetical protein [Tanacetum cinerariifolium]
MSYMTSLLNDLSYIPLNNEHNEPTQRDIGETSNEPTQATRNEFEELYASANEELYLDYDYVTRLDFMEKFTYFNVKGKLIDSIFNEMLEFFQNVLPISKGYKLPPLYYAIKKTFKTIMLGNTPGKKIPKKVLCYFPIIPRLQRLYKSSHTSKEMIWHATGKCTKPGKMQHPVDGRAWKNFDTKYQDFSNEPRNDRKGVVTIDVASSQKFNIRAMVLWTINDIPGRSSLFGWSGQGYKACLTCNEDTLSVRVLSKTAYVGHRKFLKKPHKWRSSREFNGQPDNRDPPKEFGQDKIMAQLDRLPTRLMEKSKVTAKAKQDLQRLGIQSGLWLGQTKNGKCLKPQAAYSFTPEDRKKFCQFIKRVKLPDGFGSCFKHKVTDNDTNITGLKSHDCHIMMQRLLPYGLQNYLPDKIAKPIIELCSLFKQICSTTLMEDDMLKDQIKVVDIMCDLELIYPPALFDIIIHLVIHLPLEALEGGHIRPRWMFPFKRYMKKLKGYVRNKAKPKGSIAKGYVAKEALTFSYHYFRDVTTKFNRLDRNVDPLPQRVSFRCSNRPEIDTYRSQFKSLFPKNDMKEEFPDWFGSQIRQCHVDNDKDPEVSTTSELFAFACGPTWTPISINSCVVDDVRYVVHNRDERRTTQNSGICLPGLDGEIMWFDTRNHGRKVKRLVLRNNMTQIDTRGEVFKNDQYILVTQVKQVFYLEDKAKPRWKVVEHVNHKKFYDGGVIVVEDDPDIIHFDNSSDLPLSTSLNDLDNATLHIDGQSIEVEAPPDIIDVVEEDDNIIDDEDPLPHDLADSDDEDLINVDDDGVDKVYSSEEKIDLELCQQTLHGPKAMTVAVRIVPLHTMYPSVAGVASLTETQFDLRPHIESSDWTVIEAGIQHHLQKAYNTNMAAFKAQHWVIDTETESYNGEDQAGTSREHYGFRAEPATQEYPSLFDTFFIAHTVDGVFTRDEDRLIYEMRRLEATGTYTYDEINRLAKGGKQRGHILGVCRVLPARATASPNMFAKFESGGASGSSGCGDDGESADDQEDEDGDDDS